MTDYTGKHMSQIDPIAVDRRKSRQIQVGSVTVGGDAPISVQTMTNTLTTDISGLPIKFIKRQRQAQILSVCLVLTKSQQSVKDHHCKACASRGRYSFPL